MKLALWFGTGFYVVAQAAQPILGEFGPYAQLGAVGVLGWIAVKLLGELRESRADSAKQRAEHAAALDLICTRFDGWEKIRHEDSIANQATMLEMTKTCADARHAKEG